MESLGLRSAKAFSFLNMEEDLENRLSRPPNSLPQHQPDGRSGNTITLSSSSSLPKPFHLVGKKETCSKSFWNTRSKKNVCEDSIPPEKLDEWMKDSVSEIVKNIGEAPFLMHLYSNKGKMESLPTITKTTTTNTARLEIEKVVSNGWPSIRRRWEEGFPIPDGIILVEQLKDEEEEEEEGEANYTNSTTRAWGVLVQGRGVDRAVCYILKTCRVRSSIGFCTHFSLVRAKCFGETTEVQLKNSWM